MHHKQVKLRAREVEELKTRIDKLKKELKEAEEKLDKMIGKTN